MSYRITARDAKLDDDYNSDNTIYHQVYGNNEFPEQLHKYLESKNVKFDSDDCFRNYEVTDLQELLEVMLIIHNEQVEDDSYWDLKPSDRFKTATPDGLLSYIDYKLDVAIVLTMYNFYKAFEQSFESYWDKKTNEPKYKLKNGKKIYISGF